MTEFQIGDRVQIVRLAPLLNGEPHPLAELYVGLVGRVVACLPEKENYQCRVELKVPGYYLTHKLWFHLHELELVNEPNEETKQMPKQTRPHYSQFWITRRKGEYQLRTCFPDIMTDREALLLGMAKWMEMTKAVARGVLINGDSPGSCALCCHYKFCQHCVIFKYTGGLACSDTPFPTYQAAYRACWTLYRSFSLGGWTEASLARARAQILIARARVHVASMEELDFLGRLNRLPEYGGEPRSIKYIGIDGEFHNTSEIPELLKDYWECLLGVPHLPQSWRLT